MMNKKLVFACALALVFSLSACGAKEPAASGAASSGAASSGAVSSAPVADDAQPAASAPLPEEPDQPAEPDESAEAGSPVAEPEKNPAELPAQKPVQSEKPAEKPADKPAASAPAQPASPSAADIAAKVESAMGEIPELTEFDDEMLELMYGLDADLLDGYVCKTPMMNTQATEYFVAKVKSGNMDAAEAAVEKRLEDLDGIWSRYLPEQYELVKNAKTVTSGDYILLVVAGQADAAVEAFQNALA